MEFSEACADVDYILQNMDEEDLNKIPQILIDTISFFKKDDYETKINLLEPLENQELSNTTKGLIAYIYNNYLGTQEEKSKFNSEYNEYKIKTNNQINFHKKSDVEMQSSIAILDNKKGIFARMIERIKRLFK